MLNVADSAIVLSPSPDETAEEDQLVEDFECGEEQ